MKYDDLQQALHSPQATSTPMLATSASRMCVSHEEKSPADNVLSLVIMNASRRWTVAVIGMYQCHTALSDSESMVFRKENLKPVQTGAIEQIIFSRDGLIISPHRLRSFAKSVLTIR